MFEITAFYKIFIKYADLKYGFHDLFFDFCHIFKWYIGDLN